MANPSQQRQRSSLALQKSRTRFAIQQQEYSHFRGFSFTPVVGFRLLLTTAEFIDIASL